MFRLITVLAIAGLLIACTGQGGGGADQSAGAATSAGASASAPASEGASGGASAECSHAFAALADLEITTLSQLGDLAAEVEPTVEACQSVDDWIAGAQEVVEDDINPNTAAVLLRIQCNDLGLSRTPICEELASS